MEKKGLLAPLDSQQVWRQFQRRVDSTDPLSAEISNRLLERLDYVLLNPASLLDLGAGGNTCSTAALQARYPKSLVIALDAVPQRLPKPKTRCPDWLATLLSRRKPISLAGDARHLPFADHSQNLVWSNLMLPWVNDLSSTFSEIHRVLAPNGLLLFSTLGPATLQELSACFNDSCPHTHLFPDMHDLGDALRAQGFSDPVMDMEMITVTYGALSTLIHDLRQAAGTCLHTQRHRGLRGKSFSARLEAAWNARCPTSGANPVSFEIVYGHAWKNNPPEQSPTEVHDEPLRFHPKRPSSLDQE